MILASSASRQSGRFEMVNGWPWRIDCIVGARPNFVKIAPILRALCAAGFAARLIHTGQHYDVEMNAVFFRELEIPEPDVNLEVGSGSGTEQTAQIMLKLEPILREKRADLLLVVGDVNSTLAAALVAAKLQVPLAHVEAGLRSNDRSMPEEINRLVTDRLSDMLLTTEENAFANLVREGIDRARITFVGNVMIDTLVACLHRAAPARETLKDAGIAPDLLAEIDAKSFGFVTLHRPSNVDDPRQLGGLLEALAEISRSAPLVFPVHPRTRAMIDKAGLSHVLAQGRILECGALSYLRALGLMRAARFAITDSGGVQEETTALGVPCLTVRDNTERPITIE
ncbi:MAG: UDP-N-acetylglucosamine 2-epimerase (non-hydrolyzing), partial [Rhodomicrobium sp.]